MVRTNLQMCLYGSALAWYIAELSSLEWLGLYLDAADSVNTWAEYLIKQFKSLPTMALDAFTTEKYSINDAWNYCETIAYIQAILHHIKSAGIDSTFN